MPDPIQISSPLLVKDRWRTLPDDGKRRLRNALRSVKFRRTYEHDLPAFAHDCIEWDRVPGSDGPTAYQDEIFARLEAERRLSVRGPHGIGKTLVPAIALHWFALTRDGDDWKAPTTASKWRQLREYLFPEVHKWARYLDWPMIGRDPYDEPRELQDMAIRLETGAAFAVASDDPAAIEGAHADRLLYVFDEAKTISTATFDGAEGAFAGAGVDTDREALALMLSTPGEPYGRFYDTHKRGVPGWKAMHVKLEQALEAGRISEEWVEQQAEAWGRDSPEFKRRVHGEFAAGDERSVLPLEWIEAAMDRWRAAAVPAIGDAEMLEGRVFDGLMLPEELVGPLDVAAMDVSDQGEDRTTIAERHGPAIVRLFEFPYDPNAHLMAATGKLTAILRGAESGFGAVDAIGVGAGVLARLQELRALGEIKQDPVGFIANAKSDLMEETRSYGFRDLRAEAWWGLRGRLHPTKGDDLMLPPSDELMAELTAPRWWTLSEGRIKVEEKADTKKKDRLGRSPDLADAVVMAYHSRPAEAYSQTGRGRRIPGL